MPSTLVLVHGAWHGAWCWHRLTPLLEAAGARVLAPDLPAMGGDPTPPRRVTLESWARSIADLIQHEPEPVMLVAHSLGGVVASRVAELLPGCVRRIAYVAAYLLPARATVADEARRDAGSLVPDNMIPAAGGLTCTLRAEVIRAAFYGRCPDADVGHAIAHLSPQPLKPLVTPLEVTSERFGRVPRAYVETTQDRVITLAAQRRMRDLMPCDPVFTLDSDHSPFLSQPEALGRILISI